jgi:hypothetical protein
MVKIERQVRRWRFTYSDPFDRQQHDALSAAAAYLQQNAGRLAEVAAISSANLAVLAFEIHDLFLLPDEASHLVSVVLPELDEVRHRLAALHTGRSLRSGTMSRDIE